MNLLISITIFILGTAVGSFLSVVIYRIQTEKKGILTGRSICPACRKKLKWRHLFPIVSWLFLRGKCGYCGKSISVHYIMLELITGLIFLAAFLQWNFIVTIPSTVNSQIPSYLIDWQVLEILLFYLIEFSFLIAILFYDLMRKEIPDRLSLPAIAIAIIVLFSLNPSAETAMNILVGGGIIFLFFLIQFVLSKGKWIGGGDLRLGALMGILLGAGNQFPAQFPGWNYAILGLVTAYFLGAIISLVLLAQKKIHRKSTIPFGPFLVTATIIVIFYGNRILDWYFNKILY